MTTNSHSDDERLNAIKASLTLTMQHFIPEVAFSGYVSADAVAWLIAEAERLRKENDMLWAAVEVDTWGDPPPRRAAERDGRDE